MTDSLGSAEGRIELDAAGALRALESVKSGIANLGKASPGGGFASWVKQNEQHITTLGQGLTGLGAVFLGAFGIGTKMAMDFDAQMSAVGSVSGATASELSALREEALRLGADTTFSASEAASAMEIMAKAGAPLESILNGATEAVLNLSAATGVDVPLAAETAATAMNIFGVSAEDAANLIAQSSNASSLDVNDWALALKSVGPLADEMGLSMQDVANSMVILGDAGIKGEVGATAIRNILQGLIDPAGDGAEALRAVGVETRNADGSFRGLDAITHDLAASWGDLTDAQKNQIAQSIAGEQGAVAFMAIMGAQTEAVQNNSDAFAQAEERQRSTGTAAEQAAKRMDNLKGSFEQLKGTIETIAITFLSGLMPALRGVVDGLNGLLRVVLTLPAPVQTALAAMTGIIGVLGVAGGGFLLLLPRIMATREAITALRPALLAARTAFLGFLGPIALVVAAAAALYLAYKTNFLGFADLVNGAIEGIRKFADGFRVAFQGFTQMENPVSAVLDSIANGLAGLDFGPFQGIADGLISGLRGAADAINVMVKSFSSLRKSTNVVSAAFGAIADALDSIGGGDIKWIKTISKGLRDAGKFVETFLDKIDSLRIAFGFFRSHGADPVTAALQALGRIFPQLQGVVAPLIAFVDRLKQAFSDALATGVNPIHAALLAVSTVFPVLSGFIDHTIAQFAALGHAFMAVVDAFQAFASGNWSEGFSKLGEAARQAGTAILESFLALGSLILDVFRAIDWSAVWDGARNVLGNVVSALGDLGGAILGWIQTAAKDIDWTQLLANAKDIVTGLSSKLGDLGAWAIKWVSDAAIRVNWTNLLGSAVDIVTGLSSRLGDLGAWAIKWVSDAAIGVDWKKLLVNAADIVTGLSSRLGDLGAWAIKWVADAAIRIDWKALISTASNIVNGLSSKLGDLGAWAAKWIRDAIPSNWRDLVSKATNIVTGLSSKLGDLAKWVGQWIRDGIDKAVEMWGKFSTEVSAAIPTLDFSAISGAFDAVVDSINNVIEPLQKAIDLMKAFFGSSGDDPAAPGTDGGPAQEPNGNPTAPNPNQPQPDPNLPLPQPVTQGAIAQVQVYTNALNQARIASGLLKQGAVSDFGALKSASDTNIPPVSAAFGAAPQTWTAPVLAALGAIKGGFQSQLPAAASITNTQFWMMKTTASSQSASMQAGVTSNTSAMASGAIKNAQSMRDQSSSAAGTMNSNIIKQVSQMRSGVTSATSQMIATVANNLSTMVSVGQSLVSQFSAALRSGAQTGVNGFRSAISQIPGIVASVGGSAAGIARSIGSNISQAFASGMQSALGAIRAAAAAMVAAASAALRAKAMIASPSKLFLRLGAFTGEGYELGIRSMIPDVARAMAALVIVPRTPPFAMAGYGAHAYAGNTGSLSNRTVVVNDYRTNSVTVPDAGDPEATAMAVFRVLRDDYVDVNSLVTS